MKLNFKWPVIQFIDYSTVVVLLFVLPIIFGLIANNWRIFSFLTLAYTLGLGIIWWFLVFYVWEEKITDFFDSLINFAWEKFSFRVEVDESTRYAEIKEWCKENCLEKYRRISSRKESSTLYQFLSKDDAIKFRLNW